MTTAFEEDVQMNERASASGSAATGGPGGLLDWLEGQKGGVATFYEFERRALALRREGPRKAALYRLLADLAGRFAVLFDGEPLDLATASRALATLTGFVREASGLDPLDDAALVALLNRIGMAELSPGG